VPEGPRQRSVLGMLASTGPNTLEGLQGLASRQALDLQAHGGQLRIGDLTTQAAKSVRQTRGDQFPRVTGWLR
jgi:hypothetical protein